MSTTFFKRVPTWNATRGIELPGLNRVLYHWPRVSLLFGAMVTLGTRKNTVVMIQAFLSPCRVDVYRVEEDFNPQPQSQSITGV